MADRMLLNFIVQVAGFVWFNDLLLVLEHALRYFCSWNFDQIQLELFI